ncbi:MAG: hypothetical protein IT204_19970 [Fimbriimonadaceae bacterium]|nr:hypothetical protein [Fimbriimonadaceae bacterium]
MIDKGDGMCFTAWYGWVGRMQNMRMSSGTQTTPGPHNEGKNVQYCDGHVKWLKSESIDARDLTSGAGFPNNPGSQYYGYITN